MMKFKLPFRVQSGAISLPLYSPLFRATHIACLVSPVVARLLDDVSVAIVPISQ
jgi:hypothetical protein